MTMAASFRAGLPTRRNICNHGLAKLCASPISALLQAFGDRDGQAPITGVRPEAPDMKLEMTGHVPIAAEQVRQPRVMCLVSGPFQGVTRGEFSKPILSSHSCVSSGRALFRRA
jgi:hypothetical protein